MSQLTVTDLTRVRRHPERAHYDRDTLHALLDAALICHIAFVLDGQVQQIPTACWREGEHLYIHGSNGSRMIRALNGWGAPQPAPGCEDWPLPGSVQAA